MKKLAFLIVFVFYLCSLIAQESKLPAFLTAGELIPKITGKSWEETAKKKILPPLKMNRTLLLSQELKTASNAAFPFTIVKGKLTELPILYIDNLAPAGRISSCLKDMATWLMAQTNHCL